MKVELAFLVVFLTACYVKSFNSEINGIEKFMDYGFMNIMDKTDYLPSEDMWFSGNKINYYYLGQFYATFLNKLSGIDVSYGYNYALVTLFSIAVVGVFTITYKLLSQIKTKNKSPIYPAVGATISTIAVNIAGNFHYTIYGLIIPLLSKIGLIVNNQTIGYNFWDSTRFIGYNPDTSDKTIHEFPMYSYIAGDLHAHVINIIFVITLLAILLSHLINKQNEKIDKFSVKKSLNLEVLAIGAFIGIFKMTNYWDFPIYTVVSALMFLFINLKIYKRKKECIKATIAQTITIGLLPIVISAPFMMNFDKISSAIKFVKYSTPLWQLAILWLLPTSIVIYYFLHTMSKTIKEQTNNSKQPLLINYIESLSVSDIFALIIGFSAIGLVIAPETVYVKDIYEMTQPRANTMFKLTYQSFIMFGISMGYILAKLLYNKKGTINNIIGALFTSILLSTTLYSLNATNGWFGNVLDLSRHRTMNGEAFFETASNPRITTEQVSTLDEYEVIKWIRKNVGRSEVVLEEQGEDFEYSNPISTFTANPTVIGWQGHEWLWRSTNSSTDMPESVKERTQDVITIYTSNDRKQIEELIKKYNIAYIVIGINERIKYCTDLNNRELPCEQVLKDIGDIVFETNINNQKYKTQIYKVK